MGSEKMTESSNRPGKSEAVLGGQTSFPTDGIVLGELKVYKNVLLV